MSHIKDRLTYYNDFMKKLADYHQMIPASDVLKIIEELQDALEHMTRSCKICIHTRDLYVGSRLEKITEMAGAGWMDSKGQPIKNKEEWRQVYKAMNALPDPHEITAKTEKHSYSMWLREEMKHRECGRILGQGMEPAPGAQQINNGMSGYHY